MMNYFDTATNNESISSIFIAQMLPHHKGAIQMSENLLQYTTNIPLQNIALNIVESQKKSIEAMINADVSCKEIENNQGEINEYVGRFTIISEKMFCRMHNAAQVNNINCDFIQEMIPHHQAAVMLCQNALSYKICEPLKPILYDIIKSQKKGIGLMNRLASVLCPNSKRLMS